MIQFTEKMKTIILKCFQKKYYSMKHIEIFYSNSDVKCYYKECIYLFLETLIK